MPVGVNPLHISIHGLFALGILYTLYLAHDVILPVVLALLVSLLLSPLMRRANRFGIPRPLAALTLLLTLVGAVAGIGAMVIPPAVNWLEQAPEGIARLTVPDSELRATLDRMVRSAREVEEVVAEVAEEDRPPTVVVQEGSWRAQLLIRFRDTVVAVALALTLTFFLLVSGDRLVQNFVRQLGTRGRRRVMLQMMREAQLEIGRYLGFITISNGLVGLATGLMVWALGLPEPVLWGVITALLRFIPYLGVIVTVALLAVVAAVSFPDPLQMLMAPLGYLFLSGAVGFLLEPYFHAYRMAINPVVIFLSIFFWGWLWGAIGVLLAVPLMTVIQVILRRIEPLQPVYRLIKRTA